MDKIRSFECGCTEPDRSFGVLVMRLVFFSSAFPISNDTVTTRMEICDVVNGQFFSPAVSSEKEQTKKEMPYQHAAG